MTPLISMLFVRAGSDLLTVSLLKGGLNDAACSTSTDVRSFCRPGGL
jgi:hypothetical protein